jgi:hypothetical protein
MTKRIVEIPEEVINVYKKFSSKKNTKTFTTLSKEFNVTRTVLKKVIDNGYEIGKNGKFYLHNESYEIWKQASEYYESNLNVTFEDVNKKFYIKGETFKEHAPNVFGVELRRLNNVRIDYNRNVFCDIDTADKSYWLGFILGDGNIFRNELRIKLQKTDEEHLKKFLKFIECDRLEMIKEEVNSLSGKTTCKVVICSKEIVNALMKTGIGYAKSLKEVPFYEIPQVYLRDYIRGIFDADGHIKKNLMAIGLCGSKEVMEFVANAIKENTGVNNPKIWEEKGLYRLAYYHLDSKKKILKWLYKDSNTFLNRKKKLALEILKLKSN